MRTHHGVGVGSNKNKDISDVNIVLTTEEEDFSKHSSGGSQRTLIKKNSLTLGGNLTNLITKMTRASIGEIQSF